MDLVTKKFYDGMDIQRADGFVVQTGKPADVSCPPGCFSLLAVCELLGPLCCRPLLAAVLGRQQTSRWPHPCCCILPAVLRQGLYEWCAAT